MNNERRREKNHWTAEQQYQKSAAICNFSFSISFHRFFFSVSSYIGFSVHNSPFFHFIAAFDCCTLLCYINNMIASTFFHNAVVERKETNSYNIVFYIKPIICEQHTYKSIYVFQFVRWYLPIEYKYWKKKKKMECLNIGGRSTMFRVSSGCATIFLLEMIALFFFSFFLQWI